MTTALDDLEELTPRYTPKRSEVGKLPSDDKLRIRASPKRNFVFGKKANNLTGSYSKSEVKYEKVSQILMDKCQTPGPTLY